ncbi:hypothetical protein [Spiroplasma tabanidicola]|uniref:Uncharacterized protein n=1 Tax=Spiroplasma tabanidicola TaxID=324079 RepID=A0A6I6CID1_9MOLU|nr:hypothetical protein [Spiroplasma tabanidicola]QGS51823.1 hypothetical protein STABA_v1c04600 [Spiroplasma tabanidicola]
MKKILLKLNSLLLISGSSLGLTAFPNKEKYQNNSNILELNNLESKKNKIAYEKISLTSMLLDDIEVDISSLLSKNYTELDLAKTVIRSAINQNEEYKKDLKDLLVSFTKYSKFFSLDNFDIDIKNFGDYSSDKYQLTILANDDNSYYEGELVINASFHRTTKYKTRDIVETIDYNNLGYVESLEPVKILDKFIDVNKKFSKLDAKYLGIKDITQKTATIYSLEEKVFKGKVQVYFNELLDLSKIVSQKDLGLLEKDPSLEYVKDYLKNNYKIDLVSIIIDIRNSEKKVIVKADKLSNVYFGEFILTYTLKFNLSNVKSTELGNLLNVNDEYIISEFAKNNNLKKESLYIDKTLQSYRSSVIKAYSNSSYTGYAVVTYTSKEYMILNDYSGVKEVYAYNSRQYAEYTNNYVYHAKLGKTAFLNSHRYINFDVEITASNNGNGNFQSNGKHSYFETLNANPNKKQMFYHGYEGAVNWDKGAWNIKWYWSGDYLYINSLMYVESYASWVNSYSAQSTAEVKLFKIWFD